MSLGFAGNVKIDTSKVQGGELHVSSNDTPVILEFENNCDFTLKPSKSLEDFVFKKFESKGLNVSFSPLEEKTSSGENITLRVEYDYKGDKDFSFIPGGSYDVSSSCGDNFRLYVEVPQTVEVYSIIKTDFKKFTNKNTEEKMDRTIVNYTAFLFLGGLKNPNVDIKNIAGHKKVVLPLNYSLEDTAGLYAAVYKAPTISVPGRIKNPGKLQLELTLNLNSPYKYTFVLER